MLLDVKKKRKEKKEKKEKRLCLLWNFLVFTEERRETRTINREDRDYDKALRIRSKQDTGKRNTG